MLRFASVNGVNESDCSVGTRTLLRAHLLTPRLHMARSIHVPFQWGTQWEACFHELWTEPICPKLSCGCRQNSLCQHWAREWTETTSQLFHRESGKVCGTIDFKYAGEIVEDEIVELDYNTYTPMFTSYISYVGVHKLQTKQTYRRCYKKNVCANTLFCSHCSLCFRFLLAYTLAHSSF